MTLLIVGIPVTNRMLHTVRNKRVCGEQMRLASEDGADYTSDEALPDFDASICLRNDGDIGQLGRMVSDICERCNHPMFRSVHTPLYNEDRSIVVGDTVLRLYNGNGLPETLSDTVDMDTVFVVGMACPLSTNKNIALPHTRTSPTLSDVQTDVSNALKEIGLWREGFLGIYIIRD